MNIILQRAAGLDVHKSILMATVLLVQADHTTQKLTREFKTFREDRVEMTAWLKSFDLQLVVMESTSIYWKGPYEALENAGIAAWVVNAKHVKNVPGRKTDIRDSEWLAE